jgi:sterol 3beta-glucosyltransferase
VRLTLIAFGSRGDVTPLVALGNELRAAGHAVRLISHSEFQSLATRYDLEFTGVGGSYQDFLQMPAGRAALGIPRNSPLGTLGLFKPFQFDAAEVFERCWHATADADALICSGVAVVVAGHIATRRGLPIAVGLVVPGITTRNFVHPSMPPWPLGRVYKRGSYTIANRLIQIGGRSVLATWEETATRLGGPPRHHPAPIILVAASPVLLPRPSDWPAHVHVTGFWLLPPSTTAPPADLDAFVAAGEAPLAIGFGSMPDEDPPQLRAIITDTLDQLRARAVIIGGSGGAAAGFAPSERILQIPFADYEWLFPRSSVIVHQGGVGTAAYALRSGRPQVAVNYCLDHAFWSSQLRAIGVATAAVTRHRLSARTLTAAIERVRSDPRFREAAERARAAICAEASGTGVAARLAIQHFESATS